ncbi:MAG: V-type ATP synthase subunit E family protein [Clostridia bacterium]|nr:V-type ATP synthase subunit E family protein [Clostridia bacterium]
MEDKTTVQSGKDAIIKRIQSDAEKKARGLIDSAENTAAERKKEAESWAAEYTATQEKLLARETDEIVKRRLTVADLDVRKITLSAKQKVIGEVLDLVLDGLCSLKKADYIKLVEKLIVESADDGDTVVLSNDGVLSVDDVKKLKVFTDKNLSVAKDKGDFKGGVYLVGKKCDKDLSFKSVIENGKDEYIAEISATLFGK